MGRSERARKLLEPIIEKRSPGWVSRLTFGTFVPFLAVIWIPWGVTASVLRRGVGVPLDRRFATLAAMAVVVGFNWEASVMRMRTAPISASTLLVLAAWLHDGGRSWRSVWPMTGSIGAADFAEAYYTSVAAAIALLLATALLVRGYATFAQRARTSRYSSSMNG
jgi:hypothetical protein